MPEISVIVPVYNTGKFLHRCVDSILNQTFSDFELFLVDDGSTDDSGKICDEYAAADPRVRVLHQENQGQSVARNNAIARMQGNWVHFVDSDDWIHPKMLEKLYHTAQQWNADISICSFQETAGEEPTVPEKMPEVTQWEPRSFYMQHLMESTVPVAKLIRRDCLGENRFPVGKYIDDEYIMYRVLFAAERIAFIPAPMYFYYVNMDSLTKRGWNTGLLDAWDAYDQQIAFFKERGDEELVRFCYRRYLENGTHAIRRAEEGSDYAQYIRLIPYMEKRMRSVIKRAWKENVIIFWSDFTMLARFYPVSSRIYRWYLFHKK